MTTHERTTIPLTVIGGFLGSGKTTLLNEVLTQSGGVRFAVLVNDFGDLAIDGDLIRSHDGDTITLANGCVCCTIGDNFIGAVMELLRRPDPPEHILVEASGVADPKPIADVGELYPALTRDLVIVLADVETIEEQAADANLRETVDRQIRAADLILLNKCDLIGATELERVRAWLAKRAAGVPVVNTNHAKIPKELLFLGSQEPTSPKTPVDPSNEVNPANHHDHDHGTLFRTATVAVKGPIDLNVIKAALKALPPSVLRAKGFVRTGNTAADQWIVQKAGRRVFVCPAPNDSVALTQPGMRVVLVGSPDMASEKQLRELLTGNPS